jgi:hypothetical protein
VGYRVGYGVGYRVGYGVGYHVGAGEHHTTCRLSTAMSPRLSPPRVAVTR